MTSEQKVAVITGASRGIGASLTKGFREIGYSVVANSRFISKSGLADDPAILAVDGDIAVPDTAEVFSTRPSNATDESTRSLITPASSSPSLSSIIPRRTSQGWSP